MELNWTYYIKHRQLLSHQHKTRKRVEMSFIMSVASEVATKLFDQQASKLPVLFCNLIRLCNLNT